MRRKHNELLEGAVRKQERELLQSAKLVQKLTEDRKKREESIFKRQKKYLQSLDQKMGVTSPHAAGRTAETGEVDREGIPQLDHQQEDPRYRAEGEGQERGERLV